MNIVLVRTMLKQQSKVLLGYMSGVFIYLFLVLMSYPLFADSQELNQALQSLPEPLLVALGLQGSMSDVNNYMAMNFYNSLYLYILMAFTVMTATGLISRHVDRGSMAYLLGTPVSRIRIAASQGVVLLIGLVLVMLAAYLAGIIGVPLFAKDASFDHLVFLQINLSAFLVFLVISAFSFLVSCLVNEEKQAMAISFGITLVLYFIDMASKMASQLEWLKYFTIFSFFKPQTLIAEGGSGLWLDALILLCMSVAIGAAATLLFRRKQMSF